MCLPGGPTGQATPVSPRPLAGSVERCQRAAPDLTRDVGACGRMRAWRDSRPQAPSGKPTTLRKFLLRQDPAWLADELLRVADADPLVEARLQAAAGADRAGLVDLSGLLRELDTATLPGGYIEYGAAFGGADSAQMLSLVPPQPQIETKLFLQAPLLVLGRRVRTPPSPHALPIHREGLPGPDYQEVIGSSTGATRPGTPAAGSRPAPRDNR
jgi:hypothetical protein